MLLTFLLVLSSKYPFIVEKQVTSVHTTLLGMKTAVHAEQSMFALSNRPDVKFFSANMLHSFIFSRKKGFAIEN